MLDKPLIYSYDKIDLIWYNMAEPVREQLTRAIKEDQGSVSTKTAVIGGVVAAGLLAAGIGLTATRGEPTQTQPPTTETPHAAAGTPSPIKSPDVIATPTGTFKVEVSPSPSPEVSTAPCVIFSPELCSTADHLQLEDDKGNIIDYVGVKLPAGTKLTSPMTGEESKSKLPSDQGFSSYIFNPNDRTAESYTFSGAIDLPNMNTEPIQEGKTFAVIGNMSVKSIGDHNLLIAITRFDTTQNKVIYEVDKMKSLFPAAFAKPAIKIQTGSGTSTISESTQYYGGR